MTLTSDRDEQGQLQRVELDLQSRHQGLPPEVVSEQVQAELQAFADARIRTFVPVLLRRRAEQRLASLESLRGPEA